MPRVYLLLLPILAVYLPVDMVSASTSENTNLQAAEWISRFSFVPLVASTEEVCKPSDESLPSFTVTPSAGDVQLVRVPLPFAAGTFPAHLGLIVESEGRRIAPDVRMLTCHPGQPVSVRRAIVTFPHRFRDGKPQHFTLALAPRQRQEAPSPMVTTSYRATIGQLQLHLSPNDLEIRCGPEIAYRASIIAPTRHWTDPPTVEIIEHGPHYLWLRMLVPDAHWPRILEVRADSTGTIAARLHLQRLLAGDGRCPDIGWRIAGLGNLRIQREGDTQTAEHPREHSFEHGKTANILGPDTRLAFPDAHLKKRGRLIQCDGNETTEITYLRCVEDEQVPHQQSAWRSSSFVLGRLQSAPWTALLEPPHLITIEPQAFDAIYHCGEQVDLALWPTLEQIRSFHHNAMAHCSLLGDDFGNVTSMPEPSIFGMNRLNHCSSILHEYYRMGDSRLREVALRWCDNFHDLSIWWGTTGSPLFDEASVNDWAALIHKLKAAGRTTESPAASQIWRTLSQDTQEAILATPEGQEPSPPRKAILIEGINTLLTRRNLYQEAYWPTDRTNSSVTSLIRHGPDNLPVDQVIVLNRHLLEMTFPNDVVPFCPVDESHFGGTRYNNMARHHRQYRDDRTFMWRSNSAVSFCTKGYDSFFVAYEETGDPRMATALRWQTEFARHGVHADQGECRNIGDVLDFVKLYRFTHQPRYLAEAARLFRELRTRLSPGDLFSQGGQPIVENPPFINDDAEGYKHPFAKPYIIGYALAGLPLLAEHIPDEPKLCDVIRAVADFQAQAQDPVGGWRYPHPCSAHVIISQGVEHAAQLARAVTFLESRNEPVGHLVDAIERVLQARILAWNKTGRLLGGLGGWEAAAGTLKKGDNLQDLYDKPGDRNLARDYTEGTIALGNAPPEGVVYFAKLLDFYLARRPAERLFNATPQLQNVLQRLEAAREHQSLPLRHDYLPYGIEDKLPTFRDAVIERLSFDLRFLPGHGQDFQQWRSTARARLLQCLLTPPPRAAFDPVVLDREDRGIYETRKILFSVSADCRVPAYLLVPKGQGPFPAMIALHDHGAHFPIGKEKVVRPFHVSDAISDDANRWVEKSYGNRFIGDELAKRGYVVFAMDALFWGERGRKEGPDYNLQQALSSNLLQMGMTWPGVITWDDMRSAEFVASLPEVDPDRIGAIGLSMGCHRTWMLAAATDRIAAGVAICWLGTTEALTRPGNNQVKGHSAYSMLVPDLRNSLDYPDVAAIACPKPMMFFNGEKDGLFPVDGVRDAYATMHEIWTSQGAGDRLATKLWPVGHEFNNEMQQEAFDWLDRYLKTK